MKTSSLIYNRPFLCNLRLSVCLKVRARRGGERSGYTNASRAARGHTHTHTPRRSTVSPPSPFPLSHTSLRADTSLKRRRGLAWSCPRRPASESAVCLPLGKNHSSPKINGKHVPSRKVKQWHSSKIQFKLCAMRHPAFNCDNIDRRRES